jgi:hypothetical protein
MSKSASLLVLLAVAACGPGNADKNASAKGPVHYAGNALQQDCEDAGAEVEGTVQFIAECPLRSSSPDRQWTLVQTSSDQQGNYHDFIEDARGQAVGEVPGLNDDMPFVLVWSPRKEWFAVQHHVGSFMDVPEIFQITPRGVIKRDEFAHAAQARAHNMYPCLPSDGKDIWLAGSIFKLSRDGAKLAWAFTTRPNMCNFDGPPKSQEEQMPWHSFLMISDLDTGEIVRGSVRVLPDNKAFAEIRLPTNGPYKDF